MLAAFALGQLGMHQKQDPHFGLVSLLMHMDGSLADSSHYNKTMVANGGITTSTSNPMFGSAALESGASRYVSYGSGDASLDFGSGNFTVEFWARRTNSTDAPFMGRYQVANRDFAIQANTGQWMFSVGTGANSWTILDDVRVGTVADSTYQHVALCRAGTTWYGCVGGTANVLSSVAAGTVGNSALNLEILGNHYVGSFFIGQGDEVRITKGIARYTHDFTPTGPFPNV